MTFTHYVPAFVSQGDPRAVCGAPCPVRRATEPSCPRCAAWIEADREGAEALEFLWARERARERKGAEA
jgi:hypothetical protein